MQPVQTECLAMKSAQHKGYQLTPEDIRHVLGELDDTQIAAILAIGPSTEELEEAAAWMSEESDVMGELERPLAGVVAQICDILSADEFPEERQ
jgi:hypothetical protein